MGTDIYRVVDCPTNHSNFLLPRTVSGLPNDKLGLTVEVDVILTNPQTEQTRSFQEWKQGSAKAGVCQHELRSSLKQVIGDYKQESWGAAAKQI